jgi:hypothetical protein
MGLKAMLTVDLNRTNEDQRKTFNQEMVNLQWIKIKELTTIWYTAFSDGATEEGITKTCKNDVAQAAAKAGISSYDAGVMIGQNQPTVWQKR